jgi:hypothetical protein
MKQRDDLRKAQRALIDEMDQWANGIAVLGMGGGKTAATLFSIRDGLGHAFRKAIVIAPPRTLRTAWAREPAKWQELAGLKVAILDGSPAKRLEMLKDASYDVYVISTNLTLWLNKTLRQRKNFCVGLDNTLLVIDEISMFSGPTSTWGANLAKLAQGFFGVWGLTGTPMSRNHLQLYRQVEIVAGRAPWNGWNFSEWRDVYFKSDYNGHNWTPRDARAQQEIEGIARRYMVFAPTNDLDVPEVVMGEDIDIEVALSDEQKQHLDDLTKHLIARGMRPEDLTEWLVEAASRGVATGKMTQVTQGFLYCEEEEPTILLDENPKLDAYRELSARLGATPTVVCYGYRAELDDLRFEAEKAGLSHATLGAGQRHPEKVIEAWQRGEIERLFLHPASAGHGVDGLQEGGHHMVWYHPTWSAEQFWQTVRRLARPGQKNETVVSRILAGPVDTAKVLRVAARQQDADEFMEGLRCLV